jgi:hypothetical protein
VTAHSEQTETMSDREAILDLISRWAYYRDRSMWEELRGTFWKEGTISISWFDGPFEEFVDASIRMSENGSVSRHSVSLPVINIRGDRALSEGGVIISVRSSKPVEVDLVSHARFYDMLEKREGTWRILKRTAIYETDRMDAVRPSLLFGIASLLLNFKKYPKSCRHLAFGLEKAGHPLKKSVVEDNSDALHVLYAAGAEWLTRS